MATLAQKPTPRIVPLGVRADYPEAFALARKEGRNLPTNVLHDNTLMRSDEWKKLQGEYDFGMWALELMAGPQRNSSFRFMQDIVDAKNGYRVPYDEAVKAAGTDSFVGMANVRMVITPEDVRREGGEIIVHPKKIILIEPAVTQFGVAGVVDEQTRVPKDIGLGNPESERASKNLDPLPDDNLRWNYMPDFEHVRAIKRFIHDFRRGIFGIDWVGGNLHSVGVGMEE